MDIPAYFQAEISRLTAADPVVIKTVKKDDIEETKELKVGSWENELSSYLSIDLNKPAYIGLLKKDSTDNKVTFTISNPNIDISLVEIGYEQGEPVAFTIKRTVKNSLYQTEETLNYKRNESYSLDKTQSVVALDDNHYYIEGRFKQ